MESSRTSLLEKVAYKLGFEKGSAGIHRFRVSQMVSSFSKSLDSSWSSLSSSDCCICDEKVFIFWAQGEKQMPAGVRSCYDSVKRFCGPRQVVLLDLSNLHEWIKMPSMLFSRLNNGSLSITHFSDILRFCLLEKYGGWWLDATVFLSNPLPLEKGVFTVKSEPMKEYVSKGRWSGFIWHLPLGHPFAVYMTQFFYAWWCRPDAFLPDYFIVDYCIRWFYNNNRQFQNDIDSLLVSNPAMYFFQSPLCEKPFDEEEWRRISTGTTFFKTTYKNRYPATPGSFRATLLESSIDG